MDKPCIFASQKTIKDLHKQGQSLIGQRLTIKGRLSRFRDQKTMIFGEIGDGSESSGIQWIYHITDAPVPDGIQKMIDQVKAGSSVTLYGEIVKAPERATQFFELEIDDAEIISIIRDPEAYPYGIQAMKRRSPEAWATYLKSIRPDQYRRFRHKIMAAIMRIRGKSEVTLVRFFDDLGFIKTDSPIFTKSDCEGAGEMFQVTTLPLDKIPLKEDGSVDYSKDFFGCETHLTVSGQLEAEALAQVLGKVFTFGPTFRAEHSQTSRHLAEFWMLESELVFTEPDVEERYQRLMDLEESMVKYSIDYLLKESEGDMKFLDSTCSPKLLDRLTFVRDTRFGRITYTEAVDILQQSITLANDVKYAISILKKSEDVLTVITILGSIYASSKGEKQETELKDVIQTRLELEKAISVLKDAVVSGKQVDKVIPILESILRSLVDQKTIIHYPFTVGKVFEDMDIHWGMDLASEHERYLCEMVYEKPVFITHYPQDLKSFYMKADEGCEPGRITCQAVDLLIPGIGELCGGSIREDDPIKLVQVMKKKGVPTEDLQWYIDLRYDGGLPTGGFGLGFTRLVSFLTGAASVRDTIPFPRYYGKI